MSDPKSTASTAKAKAFKPRAGIVRKSKAERDAHAQQEAERSAARAAAAAQAASKPAQTTKPGIAKKRESLRDARDGSQGVASGVFGAGTGARWTRKRSDIDGGHSEVLDGPQGSKASQVQDQGTSGVDKVEAAEVTKTKKSPDRSRKIKTTRDGPAFESDDEPEERRRDIERIWISSDEDDDDDVEASLVGSGKARVLSEGKRNKFSSGLRPVRAPRNTAVDEPGEMEQKSSLKSSKSNRTIIEDTDEQDDVEEMEVDEGSSTELPHTQQDIPSSPELSRRVKPGRKLGTRTKDNKLATETVEERAERLRLDEDIQRLKDEFTMSSKVKRDGDVARANRSGRPDGKLFLFQFPPLIPFLTNESSVSSTGHEKKQQLPEGRSNIKADPDEAGSTATEAKEDAPNSAPAISQPRMEGLLTADEPARLPPGRVGKLRIHKSGKVTLDWGGTDMEIRYGTEVDFLQDAVLVETPQQPGEGDKEEKVGTTYALGQVQKKMIVIPDWRKLYD